MSALVQSRPDRQKERVYSLSNQVSDYLFAAVVAESSLVKSSSPLSRATTKSAHLNARQTLAHPQSRSCSDSQLPQNLSPFGRPSMTRLDKFEWLHYWLPFGAATQLCLPCEQSHLTTAFALQHEWPSWVELASSHEFERQRTEVEANVKLAKLEAELVVSKWPAR